MEKEVKGTPIMRNEVADFLDVGTSDTPDIRLMNVFQTIDENPNAQTIERKYTADSATTTLNTGYKPQFPINGDLYKDNAVIEFLRDIGEEQKVGVEADYFRVRLYQPIAQKENTFYARKFRVGFEIASFTADNIAKLDGNMNQIGDVEIGEFNILTKTFSPAQASGTPK